MPQSNKVSTGTSTNIIRSRERALASVESAEEYARCLISPYDHATRIPTAYSNRSSLLKTRRTFDISAGDLSTGREFAFFVQPKLGDPSSPSGYQVGLVNMSLANPDLTNLSSYRKYDQTGASLPLDPNSPWITQGNPRAYGIRQNSAINQTYPFIGASNFTVGGGQITYGGSWQVVQGTGPLGPSTLLTLAPGSYLIAIHSRTSANSIEAIPLIANVIPGAAMDDTVGYVKLVYSTPAGVQSQVVQYAVNVTEFDRIALSKAVLETTNFTDMLLIATPLCSPEVSWSSDYGLTEQVRPVGMSVLTTCVLSKMYAGGQIQSAMMSGSSKDKVFSGSWLGPTGFNNVEGYFTGNLEEGNYMWWRPFSQMDIQFKAIAEANKYEYPIMLVKGKVPPVPAEAGSPVICQVTVEFVYEILQNSQLLERKRQVGSTEQYESALRAVQKIPYASENPKHSDLLKKVNKVLDTGGKLLPLFKEISGWFL